MSNKYYTKNNRVSYQKSIILNDLYSFVDNNHPELSSTEREEMVMNMLSDLDPL